jgi:type IV secretory pathway VirB2 component (pilin)
MGTFAIAALVVAILFSDRLGGSEELRRRFFQVGLGVAVILLVGAVATVIVPTPDYLLDVFNTGGDADEVPGILKERVSIMVGAGLLLLLGAVMRGRTYPTLAPGVMLGAIVLTMMAVAADSSGFASIYYQVTLDGGEARNAAYAGVVAIGTALLLGYGYKEWERPEGEGMEEEFDEA